jgi:hypothetical protein
MPSMEPEYSSIAYLVNEELAPLTIGEVLAFVVGPTLTVI